jgi:hypothetical protein
MSISDYYFDEINSEENLQELNNQELPSCDGNGLPVWVNIQALKSRGLVKENDNASSR